MTAAARIEKDAVLAALTPERVLEHFSIDYRRAGAELRFQICPECGPRSRADTVSVNRATGRWRDLAHDCAGDLLAMVALFAGVDIRRDFARVLVVAADIAGVA
jgi:hypothetical protein